MGKIKQIVHEDLEPYEAVDAVASVVLKDKHKIYGNMIRLLANAIKGLVGDEYRKGSWQPLWTIATKAFSMGVKGWSLETTIDSLKPQADKLANFPLDKFNDLVKIAWELGQQYAGALKRQQPREVTEVLGI